jgi:hypothetical protein
MDPKLIEEIGLQQYKYDRQIGNLLVRLVPQTWKAIDLHVFVEWHPHHLDLGLEIESPEDYPSDEAPVSDELSNVVEEYVRMFKKYDRELTGMYITMRQKDDGNWHYKVKYEWPEGAEL